MSLASRYLLDTPTHESGLHDLGVDLPCRGFGKRPIELVLPTGGQRHGQRYIRAVVGLLDRAVVIRQQVQNNLV